MKVKKMCSFTKESESGHGCDEAEVFERCKESESFGKCRGIFKVMELLG